MQNRAEQQHQSPRDVPPVGRPRGATWRSIQADGVVWEGQVLMVGGEVDLAARMVVTHRRVIFIRGGEIVLEMPRGWLRQEPVLRRDGVLELFVSTPDSGPFDEPMRVPLRMREGHPAAGHIIAMLAPGGVRRIAPEAMSAFERARDASAPVTFDGFWDGVEGVSGARQRQDIFAGFDDGSDTGAPAPASADLSKLAPLEPPDRLVRTPSNPPRPATTNPYPITGMLPRDQRRSQWTWLLRVAALFVLLVTAAALGAGRLNLHLPGMGGEPVLTAPDPTMTASSSEPLEAGSETDAPALSPDELTAVAIGVGGAEEAENATGTSDSAIAAATEAPQPTAPAIAEAETVIPTPAAATEAEAAPSEPSQAPAAADEPATAPVGAPETPAEAPQNGTQAILAGPLRVTLSTALRDESLPKYGLPPGSGEWVVVLAEVTNDSDDAASIAMSDFRLLDRGSDTVATLDTGTDVIASLAGLKPAHGASDVIAVDPGDSAETLLLYLLPAGSSDDLALLVGDDEIDLGPSFAAGAATPAEGSQIAFLSSNWRGLRNQLTP